MLEVQDLTVSRDKRVILHHVSLVVPTGSVTAVLGSSGSGKTTLLRAIAGLIRIDTGIIHVDGRNITHMPSHKRNIGLMFQDGQLFPTMTVGANIAFGLKMQNKNKTEQQKRVEELLALVHLPDYQDRDVPTLSGGELRRVALARALAPTPPVLLLDEPLTGLEEDFRYDLAQELADILHNTGITAVVVTHDRKEAEIMADNIAQLVPRGSLTGNVDGGSVLE